MTNPEMRLPRMQVGKAKLIVSIDDYHPENLRLAADLRELGIRAMFYVETQPDGAHEQVTAIHGLGHEIGCHTWSHPGDMKLLNVEEMRAEIEIAKRQIEDATGCVPRSIAYPRGRFNDLVIQVAQACGFDEGRTTHVGQLQADDPMRQGTTVHAYNGRKEYHGRSWRTMADFWWAQAKREGGTFHIWAHLFELERDGQYQPFLDFLREIKIKQ